MSGASGTLDLFGTGAGRCIVFELFWSMEPCLRMPLRNIETACIFVSMVSAEWHPVLWDGATLSEVSDIGRIIIK